MAEAPAVRRATIADVPALAPLFDAYRQFYQQAAAPAQAQAYLQARLAGGESVVLLAALAHVQPHVQLTAPPLGFCQLYPTFCSVALAPIYCLYDLYVVPSARRGGIARALMRAAERHAVATGAVRLDLSTARTNRAAQALYESLGWIRDDVFHVYSRSLPVGL